MLEAQIMTIQLAPSVGIWCFSEFNAQCIEAMQRDINHWRSRPFWPWRMLRGGLLHGKQYWGLLISNTYLVPLSRAKFSRTWWPRSLNTYQRKWQKHNKWMENQLAWSCHKGPFVQMGICWWCYKSKVIQSGASSSISLKCLNRT